MNGEGDKNRFSSKEILANPSACASGDQGIANLRNMLGAKIVCSTEITDEDIPF